MLPIPNVIYTKCYLYEMLPIQTEVVRQGFPPENQQETLLDNQFLALHDHGNQLLVKKAKEYVVSVLDNLANVPAATTKAVLQKISTNILASSSPRLLSSTSSAGAVKMALWRKEQKINPRPKIPESHLDIMEEQIDILWFIYSSLFLHLYEKLP